MERLSNGTQVSTIPTPASTVGTPGFFTNGNPSASVAPSLFDQDWFNAVQEELCSILAAAGNSPTPGLYSQVLNSLQMLFRSTSGANGFKEYTTPGAISYTVPPGVYFLRARVWGPGGNGSAGTSTYPGGGGGGGGFAEGVISVTPGQVIAGNVGASATGTSTTFGTSAQLLTASAGQSASNNANLANGIGGAGGSGSGGTSNRPGAGGLNGIFYTTTSVRAGEGGAAWCCPPTPGSTGTVSGPSAMGGNGTDPGCGGAGGFGPSGAGGLGGNGMIQVEPG